MVSMEIFNIGAYEANVKLVALIAVFRMDIF